MRLMPSLIVGLFSAVVAGPVAAQNMNAEEFYQRARKLEAKGMAALFASDLKPTMGEFQAAGKIVHARRLAAEAKGDKLYCPPPKAKFGPKDFLKLFGNIRQAEREQMTTTEAFQRVLVTKFPC